MIPELGKGLLLLEHQITNMKIRIGLPAYANTTTKQGRVINHFINRALQIGEANYQLCRADLTIPLTVLVRVLCEDFFICFWVARSEEDAEEYCKAADAESVRLLRIMFENKVATAKDISTHEDATSKALEKLRGMSTNGFKIEQLAIKLGLSRLYDLLYRSSSVEVHGKGFDWFPTNDEKRIPMNLTATVSLVGAIGLIADNRMLRSQPTNAEELLKLMDI